VTAPGGPLGWEGLAAASPVPLDAGAVDRLRRLSGLLAAANARTNLTRIAGEAEFVEKHALDALLGAPLLPAGPLVDVGSGGGVPGLVLAIVAPERPVLLVEAVRKKTAFLEDAVRALALERVAVRWGRAEEVGREPERREAFAGATVRAVGPVAACLELTLPLVRVGGAAVLYRGPAEADAEDAAAAAAAPLLGGGAPVAHARTLPSGAARRLVVVPKEGPTPERFPRRPGVPAKRPLS